MAACPAEDEWSDDEIFMGKLTLKEIKIRLLQEKRRTTSYTKNNYDNGNISNESIQIIETHSEPEMDLNNSIDINSDKFEDWEVKSTDDSFLNLEKLVTELSKPPNVNNDLDNTLEVVNFILDNTAKEQDMNNKDNEQTHRSDKEPDKITTESSCEMLKDPMTNEMVNDLSITSHLNIDLSDIKTADDNIILVTTPSDQEDGIDKECEYLKLQDKQCSLNSVEMSSTQLHKPDVHTQYNDNINLPLEHEELKLTTNISNKTPIKDGTMQTNKNVVKINDSYEAFNKSENTLTQANEAIFQAVEYDKPDYRATINSQNICSAKKLKVPILEIALTPIPVARKNDIIFKTPKNPENGNNYQASSMTKSPGTRNNYKHVQSPVALYIKCSPQTPLVQNIIPKKPLPKVSCIPKLKKNPAEVKERIERENEEKKEEREKDNKENVELPKSAYRSAKKTALVKLSNNKCIPGEWAKKLNLSEAVVRKHISRRINQSNEPVNFQEDSFANLSLIPQADLSIHIETSAFTNLKP